MGYHIPGSMCVGVTVWFGWGGVVWCHVLGEAEVTIEHDFSVT